MTKKNPRNVTPYTANAAVSGLGGYTEALNGVLDKYFPEETWQRTSKRIHRAIQTFYLSIQTNPSRQIARKQRDDRDQLIECMKELNIRLHPMHTPPPLMEPARSAYARSKRGKPTLEEEVRDLLLRLLHLQRIFEATTIPLPARTNPGKPECKKLVQNLEKIFDDLTRSTHLPSILPEEQEPSAAERHQNRKQFVQEVFAVFHLDRLPSNVITLP
jgi:hypothetical protein